MQEELTLRGREVNDVAIALEVVAHIMDVPHSDALGWLDSYLGGEHGEELTERCKATLKRFTP